MQKAFDDILRLPYINEAEVSDIISKVYQSAATRVSYKQLQKVNPYKIESPREPIKRKESVTRSKSNQRWRDKHIDKDEGEHYSYSEDSVSEKEEDDPLMSK